MGVFSDIANRLRELAAQREVQNGPVQETRDVITSIDREPVREEYGIEQEVNKLPEPVKYTYKKGDNFAKVLVDLGLSDGTNLWGDDGDVKYYESQLKEQGIEGNIPIGTTIELFPRVYPLNEFPYMRDDQYRGLGNRAPFVGDMIEGVPRDIERFRTRSTPEFRAPYTYPYSVRDALRNGDFYGVTTAPSSMYVQNPNVNTNGMYVQPQQYYNPAGRFVKDVTGRWRYKI